MKKLILVIFCLTSSAAFAEEYGFNCSLVEKSIKRCENSEVICYIYDSGWAGFMKSGRGAGISCVKK